MTPHTSHNSLIITTLNWITDVIDEGEISRSMFLFLASVAAISGGVGASRSGYGSANDEGEDQEGYNQTWY